MPWFDDGLGDGAHAAVPFFCNIETERQVAGPPLRFL